MKKIISYAILLLIVTIVTVSGTYAIFTAVNYSDDLTDIGSHQIQVKYSGDTEIAGYIELVRSKEGGFRRTVSIALGEDSVPVAANLYIHLEQIDAGFSSKGLKWELYELTDNEDEPENPRETKVDSGTFEGYQSGQRIYMLKDLELTKETKKYAVYIWLNGYEASNEVVGAVLRGYIGAESNQVSATITE